MDGVLDRSIARSPHASLTSCHLDTPNSQGFSIVLKLNGRVGQRAIGPPNWERLAGDVERRRSRGLDVTNI